MRAEIMGCGSQSCACHACEAGSGGEVGIAGSRGGSETLLGGGERTNPRVAKVAELFGVVAVTVSGAPDTGARPRDARMGHLGHLERKLPVIPLRHVDVILFSQLAVVAGSSCARCRVES